MVNSMDSYAQSVIENSRTWHDLGSLQQLRASGDSKAAITEAAKQFESVFFSMMMKSMREASNAIVDKPFFDSPSLDLFQDMYDKQLSLNFGSGPGTNLGIAEALVEQLTRGRTFNTNDNVQNVNLATTVEQTLPVQVKPSENIQPVKKVEPTPIAEAPIEVGSVTGPSELTQSRPTEVKGMDFSSPAAFVKSLLPTVQQYARNLRMDPKLVIAQAALETGWGKFVMRTIDGVSSNNLFGIKADRAWDGDSTYVDTLEFEQGQLKQTKAAFRSYANHEESVKDYFNFLKANSRYDKALDTVSNPRQYLNELQNAGYATDPDYAEKIYQIYNSDSLTKAIDMASQQSMR